MTSTDSAGLQVRGLSRHWGATAVWSDLALSVPGAATLALLGPSGCGKTTLLRVLAGLDRGHAGSIRLDGRELNDLPPQQRRALYLFQEPLLFPHLDVFENLAFGLRLRPRPPPVAATVERLLEELELAGLQRRRPEQLSGGQRQRVAFGRALAIEPRLLLLDEPFSSLDADARAAMQRLFRRIARERRITAVFVTHDLREALQVGDRFARFTTAGLRQYRSRADFCADPASGVAQELAFWRDLGTAADATPGD